MAGPNYAQMQQKALADLKEYYDRYYNRYDLQSSDTLVIGSNIYTTGSSGIVTNLKKESKMFGIYGSLKQYIAKHSDLIFTVAFVMLADRWFFGGAFKNTLQGLVGKLIAKADAQIESTELKAVK